MQESGIFEDPTFEQNLHIQQKDAIRRAKCINDVSYTVELAVPTGEWYAGRVTIEFKLREKPTGQDLFLDFRGTKIGAFEVNDTKIEDAKSKVFHSHRITLPTALLKDVGQVNKVSMLIINKYRTDGIGFHSFIDKEDSTQYVYTKFEP